MISRIADVSNIFSNCFYKFLQAHYECKELECICHDRLTISYLRTDRKENSRTVRSVRTVVTAEQVTNGWDSCDCRASHERLGQL